MRLLSVRRYYYASKTKYLFKLAAQIPFRTFTWLHICARVWMLWIFRKVGENNERNTTYQFWQQDNHPIECSTEEILATRMNYLHENPVRAGFV